MEQREAQVLSMVSTILVHLIIVMILLIIHILIIINNNHFSYSN